MNKSLHLTFCLLIITLINLSSSLGAPFVSDPMSGRASEKGRVFYKWVLDINHDGINDVLVGEKLTDIELKDDPFPNQIGFGIYLGQKGGGFINVQYVAVPDGQEIGIGIDISQCYVGYVSEVSAYGIVTTASTWDKKTDTTTVQVVCYTVDGDHMKETYLGGVMDPAKPNIYYTKYLSPAHRTTVQLQEFTQQ